MQQVSVPVTMRLIPSEDAPGTQPRYATSTSKGLGITQIVIGITCILLQILSIFLQEGFFLIGHGIWCGVFFVVPGSFGLAAGKTKKTGFIITFMVLSILAAAGFATCLLSFAAVGVNICYNNIVYYHTCNASIITQGLLCALAVFEAVIAIISSAICCRPLCCPYTHSTTGGQPQYGTITNGQVVLAAGPPAGQPQYFFPRIHVAASPQPEPHSGPPYQIGIPAQLQPTAVNTDQPPPAYLKTGDIA